MVLKKGIQVFDGLLKVSALIKNGIRYSNERTFFIGDYSCSSRNIIYQRHLSKGISRIIVYILLLSFIFRILRLDVINSF